MHIKHVPMSPMAMISIRSIGMSHLLLLPRSEAHPRHIPPGFDGKLPIGGAKVSSFDRLPIYGCGRHREIWIAVLFAFRAAETPLARIPLLVFLLRELNMNISVPARCKSLAVGNSDWILCRPVSIVFQTSWDTVIACS